uniref:Uncharacterized protein n=1 Tax=Tanacetum cinerariifolium TaxID=118510 RepID=A0A699GN79_TANCI|nr:hypothetical protein [Tanacetum cinerariifolium]
MEDDLFTYELRIVEDFYFLCIEQPHDNLKNDDLDVYEPRWLNVKFGDHRKVDKEIMKEVVSTWFIRSYKRQFEEYMKIKSHLEKRGHDEEVLTDKELSDLEEEKVSEEKEIAEIFKIETDIFEFETPLSLEDDNLKDEALKEKPSLKDHEDMRIEKERTFTLEEERFKEWKSKLLGMPYKKSPTFKSKKFEVIKYSLGPEEEYVAIKEYEYDIWLRTEENVSCV